MHCKLKELLHNPESLLQCAIFFPHFAKKRKEVITVWFITVKWYARANDKKITAFNFSITHCCKEMSAMTQNISTMLDSYAISDTFFQVWKAFWMFQTFCDLGKHTYRKSMVSSPLRTECEAEWKDIVFFPVKSQTLRHEFHLSFSFRTRVHFNNQSFKPFSSSVKYAQCWIQREQNLHPEANISKNAKLWNIWKKK